MDPKFQTSFIPKKPMIPGSMGIATKKPTSVLSVVAVLMVVIVVLMSVGAFLYNQKLSKDNTSKKQQIEQEIKTFDPTLTDQLTVLKSRIDSAKELLKNHLALTNFFNLLNENTVSTIQFREFSYTGGPGKPLLVKLAGKAKNFNDLIFQSDTILANPHFKNAVFSGFLLDKEGNVLFNLDTEIDPGYVSYQKSISEMSEPINSTQTVIEDNVSTSTATTSTP